MPAQRDNRPHGTTHSINSIIVGAGVAGSTLAYELSKTQSVTVLEAGELTQEGASSVPVALLNPHRGRSAKASELDQNGLTAMWDLVSDLEVKGYKTGVHQSGVLRIASSPRQEKMWRKHELPYLGTLAAPYNAPYGALLVEKGGWLEPALFLKALHEAAQTNGAHFVENCRVESVKKVQNAWRVASTGGEFEADRVIICVGASQLGTFVERVEGFPKLERVEGDVLSFATDLELSRPIAGAVYGAQTSSGVTMGGNHRPLGEVDAGAVPRLQKSSGWFIRGLADAPITSHWRGVRAKRENNAPLISELQPGLWFYGALGGRGFLCSAYLSEKLVEKLA